ncbi:hypothetical protein [Rhizobium leguminosarum]|uniref:hypothetical protein n=1 Tax=Rhizobium leguminosarum TaxID=384 RepID=UPI001C8FAFF5|nr:hypothetical protein [Rhizobium leguminosarum]MBY3044835.1 hypothetical protein [Rhizobium leguminosarum]
MAIFSARVQADFHRHHPTPFTSDQSEIISEISTKLIQLEKADEDQERENALLMASPDAEPVLPIPGSDGAAKK